MSLLEAIFLGLLQGGTEFLPISSSGHLALAHFFLGSQEGGMPFDVALHLGSLLAVILFFRKDFGQMLTALLQIRAADPESRRHRQLVWLIVLATIPGVVAGLVLDQAAGTTFRAPAMVAGALAGAGALLLWADRRGRRSRSFQALHLPDALVIGLAQALAIIPGVSRSGITITAALGRNLDRQAAVRFSFLLSAPIIFGAGVYKIPAIWQQGLVAGQWPLYLTGFISAALSGYLFIAFLMRFVRTRSFAIFAYYRFLLAGLVLLALFW